MRQSILALTFSAASALAVPMLEKRIPTAVLPNGDIDILNYALTLEYLERKFYHEGLANYTEQDFVDAGYGKDFYKNLQTIAFDESSHVDFLAGALGDKAVHEASYAFPSTTAAGFVGLAAVIEGVGVSAYLGAAAEIMDKNYLTAAGSILTVEARHTSYIRSILGENPVPRPYDTPLDFNQVFSIAAQFITGFAPEDPALPFAAFPPLTVAPSVSPSMAGSTQVIFTGAYKNAMTAGLATADTKVYAVLYSGLDQFYVEVCPHGDDYVLDMIPGGDDKREAPSGQVYVVLSTNGTKATDENTISGVGILEILEVIPHVKY